MSTEASETLKNKLQYKRAYKKTRLEIADWVLENPYLFPQLLDFCFKIDEEISYRAAWILELVLLKDLKILHPHLEQFFANLPQIHKEQALRSFSKICWLLTRRFYKKNDALLQLHFRSKHREILMECAFDWLLSEKKVATQSFAIKSLYLLGTEYEWIHPELKTIIGRNLPTGTPGYVSIGTKTIAAIKKSAL